MQSSLTSAAWLTTIFFAVGWTFRGFFHPGVPVLLDHPIHYAEFLYMKDQLIPGRAWISGWCNLHMAGFPLLVTYSVFGYLPAVALHYCLALSPEAAYKCAVFLAYAFAVAMMFFFLRRHVPQNAAGIATLLWALSPATLTPCAHGLWLQYWGIGFFLILLRRSESWSKLGTRNKYMSPICSLATLLVLITLSHVYTAMAAGVFLVAWIVAGPGESILSRGRLVLVAGGLAVLLGAFYIGPFLESIPWLASGPKVPHIPFLFLARRVAEGLWAGSGPLVALAAVGIAIHLKEREKGPGNPLLLFLLFTLGASLAPWQYLPLLRKIDVLANLHLHGGRSLLYAQLPAAYFAGIAIGKILSSRKSLKIFSLVLIALVLIPTGARLIRSSSPFITLEDLWEKHSIEKVRNWISGHSPGARGLVQSTLGNVPGVLGQSHVMALNAFWTEQPQIGDWIGGTLYPHEQLFLTESGRLFGKDIQGVSNLELLRRFQTYHLKWAVACEPRLKQKLESSGFFDSVLSDGPFTVYTLGDIFYNPTPWKADSEGVTGFAVWGPEQGMLRLDSPRDHVKITLKQTAHPFWRVWVDGKPWDASKNEDFQIVVELPRRGVHVLNARFVHPKTLWLWISAMTACALGIACWFNKKAASP